MPGGGELAEALRALREEVEALRRLVVQMRLEDLGALVNEVLVRRSLLYARRLLMDELRALRASADPSCPHRNACLEAVEKGMDEVMERFLLGGPEEALRAIEEREMALRGLLSSGACPSASCLERSSRWLRELKELMTVVRKFMGLEEAVRMRVLEGLGEIEPELLARLAEPLSHGARVAILRLLREGPRTFSELEEALGMRAGHLRFHLNKLLKASFIVSLGRRSGYAITRLGSDALRALEMLYALHKDYLALGERVGGGPEGGEDL